MKTMLRSLNNILHRLLLLVALALAPGQLTAQVVAAFTEAKSPPQLLETAPAMGTFYLLGRIPSVPYPFDPYRGARPVYAYDGVFFVDDTAVSFLTEEFSLAAFGGEEGGGMMMAMSAPAPGGGGSTNSGTNLFCNSLTNFVVGYLYSTNGLALGIAQTTNPWMALTIQTATTNASYDVFGTTNLVALAPTALSKTNWTWLVRASGGATNFSWGLTNWCERYFQLGTMTDTDSDGLTDAYENLVSHTDPNNADTDGDGLSDGWEVENRLNPLLDDSGQPGSRRNFVYDGASRLKAVSGVQSKVVGIDAEGNLLQLSQ